MPIKNGYEACQNIRGLFNNRKLFKLKSSSLVTSNNETKQVLHQPVMVAASSLVNEVVLTETQKVGFDLTLSIPVTKVMI